MKIIKCDLCGKFRKSHELSSQASHFEEWLECYMCMSKSTFEMLCENLLHLKLNKELEEMKGKRND